jgi:UDP-N-acetylmuramate dehydrogenase
MFTAGKTSIDWREIIKILKDKFGELIESDKPLAPFNTFGTGGMAKLFAEVHSEKELSSLIKESNRYQLPIFMLGGGSNLLVSDYGYDGLVIRNSIMGLKVSEEAIIAGAGESLQEMVDFATNNGLAGLEFATGIWGTVGGAIFGNAGAYGLDISSALKSVQLVDKQGNIRNELTSYFEFSYRNSVLKKTGEFVAHAEFSLRAGKKEEIRKKTDEILAERRKKLPFEEHSAGCFFKNIVDKNYEHGKLPAGKLLEEVGAKEIHYGGACVFEKHANIIINNGSATSKDIRNLAEILKSRVKEKFGIELREEITYLGTFEEEGLSTDL